MRKWAIGVLVFAIAGVLQLSLVPMMVLEYSEDLGPEFETAIVHIYFNGSVKFIEVVDGERMVFNMGSIIWKDIIGLVFPSYILILTIAGFALFFLATLFKIIYPDKEDRRISAAAMILGGISGLLGGIFYNDFGNDLIAVLFDPAPKYFYGYYINIGFFAICILIGVIFQILSFIKPFADEKDLWEDHDKLLNLTNKKQQ